MFDIVESELGYLGSEAQKGHGVKIRYKLVKNSPASGGAAAGKRPDDSICGTWVCQRTDVHGKEETDFDILQLHADRTWAQMGLWGTLQAPRKSS